LEAAVGERFPAAASLFFVEEGTMRTHIAFSVALLFIAGTARAQETTWRTVMDEALARDLSGDLAGALGGYREAVRLAEQFGPSDQRLWASLNMLAIGCYESGMAAEAAQTYNRLLREMEAAGQKDSPDAAHVMTNLGRLYVSQNRIDQGAPLLRRALAIYERQPKPDDYCVAATRGGLAELLLARKEYRQAEEQLEKALPIYVAHAREAVTGLAAALTTFAEVRIGEKRYQEGAGFAERAVHALEDQVAADHPWLIYPTSILAQAYADLDRASDAEAAFQRSLSICERHLPADHPVHGRILALYAGFLQKHGRKPESKKIAAKARQILHSAALREGQGMTVDVSAFRPDR
jgi:tetratricopeptide (TPR) repeat protein